MRAHLHIPRPHGAVLAGGDDGAVERSPHGARDAPLVPNELLQHLLLLCRVRVGAKQPCGRRASVSLGAAAAWRGAA